MTGRVATQGVCILLAGLLVSAPLRVGAGTFTGGASEWTEIANHVQLIEHTINLIQMVVGIKRQIEYMAQHAKSIRSPEEFLSVMQNAAGLIGQMRGILFASGSIIERWKTMHPGNKDLSKWYSDPADAYKQIDESTRQAVQRSMEVLELQANTADGWPQDRTILAQLAAKAQTADGQLKAAQVANDLLLEVIRQLHLLRGVQIAHAEMTGYQISGETQRRQFEDKFMRSRRFGYTGRYRGDSYVDPTTTTW